MNPDQGDQVGLVVAQAFLEDPCFRYIFPERDRRLSWMCWLFTQGAYLFSRRGMVLTTDNCAGAAFWMLPSIQSGISMTDLFRFELLRAIVGMSFREQKRLIEIHADALYRFKKLVKTPHWVLDTLGVAPYYQGEGVGSALVKHVLDLADVRHEPSFVITHNYRNVAFYRRFGFEVVASSSLSWAPIIVTALRRPAR